MWREYSSEYLKNNRTSGLSVMVAAFISALLLSLLSGLFYNLWRYEVIRIETEEGKWHSRITGDLDEADLAFIRNYGNVREAVLNGELSDEKGVTVDVCLKNMRTVLIDMPRIAHHVGLALESVTYHHALLNLYLIRDPADLAPRLVFPLFLFITAMAGFSLIMIIHNSFEVSMNARIHQFGIFSSIGATPKQIRLCLLQEAAALCVLPIIAGNLFGILMSMGVIEGINGFLANVEGRLKVPFQYHPLILVCSLVVSVLIIWISAWIPAEKMSRMTPLEAIRNVDGFQLHKKKDSHILALLFGVEGELAGNGLKAQKKALRTATVSLTCSFLAFALMTCFLTLIKISQRMTYFEKYQNSWDVMATIKSGEINAAAGIDGTEGKDPAAGTGTVAGTGLAEGIDPKKKIDPAKTVDRESELDRLRKISGVESVILYQKAEARRLVAEEEISREMKDLGGFESADSQYVSAAEDGWMVSAPLMILDDDSFLAYCGEIGAEKRLDGVVIRNLIPDFTNPNFRNRDILPYLKENRDWTILYPNDGNRDREVRLPILGYTDRTPVLREEYGTLNFYELVHFIPLSLWKRIREEIGGTEEEGHFRILAKKRETLADLDLIEEEVKMILRENKGTKIESRIREKTENDAMYEGMMMILGSFCVLLAIIGIGNVFSNTLGFVRQRKREFARYLSIGLTPEGMRKMFCIEALVIAGRPVLVTLPFLIISIGLMLKLSYLEPMIFIREAPVAPILIFILTVFGFVALAYYLGGRKLLHTSLVEALGDDTLC